MDELVLSSHALLPREGHLEAVDVMVHVGQRYNVRLVYDLSYPKIDHRGQSVLKVKKWFLDIHEHSVSAVVLKETFCS